MEWDLGSYLLGVVVTCVVVAILLLTLGRGEG